MALQSNAALLDELMGKHRNVAPGACINAVRFDDEEVCKYFLVSFCPHDLFVNTRADLGPCTKIHDEEMKKQYEKSSRYGKLGYEDDFERFLRNLLSDVERKIRRGMERLKLTQNDVDNKKTPLQLKQERLASLKEQINTLIKEAESQGEQGNIEEAQNKLEESEKLKSECRYLENQLELAAHNNEQKQMEVCNVCGSFLIINDAQSRVEEHVSGKQHKGYAQLRTALEDIRKKRIDELEKREKERERERERERRERERERERERDRDRDRHRNRSPDRRRDSRDRRDHDSKDRDRDRDRDRTDKDKDRDRRRSSKSPSKNNHHSSSSSSSSLSSSKRNGSSSSISNSKDEKDRRDKDKDKDKERRASYSDSSSSKRHRSRSRSRERSKHQKRATDAVDSLANGKHENGSAKDENKSKILEQQTDEFLKLVDDITKSKKTSSNDEKEEGEADDDVDAKNDDDMDEGEIRGH